MTELQLNNLRSPIFPGYETDITRENWQHLIDDWRGAYPEASNPDIDIVIAFNICPVPLITSLSGDLISIYTALGGFGNISYKEFLEMPHAVVSAFQTISAEEIKMQERIAAAGVQQ